MLGLLEPAPNTQQTRLRPVSMKTETILQFSAEEEWTNPVRQNLRTKI